MSAAETYAAELANLVAQKIVEPVAELVATRVLAALATREADPFLDSLAVAKLVPCRGRDGEPSRQAALAWLRRHLWQHVDRASGAPRIKRSAVTAYLGGEGR